MQAIIIDKNIVPFISNLKHIIICGEAFPSLLLNSLKNITNARIYNMYGPTETTVFSTGTDLTFSNIITIGKPIANTYVYILDNNQKPLPIGVPGELYVAGDGVGIGYINNINQTKENFIKNPFISNSIMYKTGDICRYLENGNIEYLGRKDNQIKIRGLRIELGEIEDKISSFPNVKKACVIKQSFNNRDYISAYLTIQNKINLKELKRYLSEFLPKYMIPSYFSILDDFTYTPNGKIDKKALPYPKEISANNENDFIPAKTELERKIVTIWEKILNISPIGITDNFFELGGDSISAMNLQIELMKITDKISYADIFKYPTIEKIIQKINTLETETISNFVDKNFDKYNNILGDNKNIPNILELSHIEQENILLTGATGFLGIHILNSFLDNTAGNIYCIIRPEQGISAEQKLKQKLKYYFDDKYDNLIGKRIFVIEGFIDEPDFRLSKDALEKLSNNVQIVVNSAANVAHYGNYEDFYNANIKSVKNLIDFCKLSNKKFYQISTLSVSGNTFDFAINKQNLLKKHTFEECDLYIGQALENVYVRSKFEAECLVLDAILAGVDGYILRMGNLMPRALDGIFQDNIKDNGYINRLISFIKLGGIPESLKDGYLEFTPVDEAANSIIKLILHNSKTNRVFHLFNHNHVVIQDFIRYCKVLNPDFKILANSVFKERVNEVLKNNERNNNYISGLINDFDKDLNLVYDTGIKIKSDYTIKYLEKVGFNWSKITKQYIVRFINLLRGLL